MTSASPAHEQRHHPDTGEYPPRAVVRATSEWLCELAASGVVVCPNCRGRLQTISSSPACAACRRVYLTRDGLPVLLHDDSAFTAEDVCAASGTFFRDAVSEHPIKRRVRRALPALALDVTCDAADTVVRASLPAMAGCTGLVVGTGDKAGALRARFPSVNWIVTDVDLAYTPLLVADVLGLPIADESMDIVVADMVLEHTFDIVAAAREIERVCKRGGVVLVKVPFCFPWHGVPFDFFRCTPAGLRSLFRSMGTLYLDHGMGSWGALAYQLETVFVNLTRARHLRMAGVMASRFAFGWLKWIDRLRAGRPGGLDAAAGLTFVGRKADRSMSARELRRDLLDRYAAN